MEETMLVTPEHENLQYSGRIDFDDPAAPVLVYAASYVKLVFTGTFVKVKLENHHSYWTNEMGYFIDGEQRRIRLRGGCEV